jgi:hypothetical protein
LRDAGSLPSGSQASAHQFGSAHQAPGFAVFRRLMPAGNHNRPDVGSHPGRAQEVENGPANRLDAARPTNPCKRQVSEPCRSPRRNEHVFRSRRARVPERSALETGDPSYLSDR